MGKAGGDISHQDTVAPLGSCAGTRPRAPVWAHTPLPIREAELGVLVLTISARCPSQDPLLDRLGRQPAPHRGRLHERRGPAHHPQGDGLGGLAQRAHCRLPGEAHPLDRRQVGPGHPPLPHACLFPSPLDPCPLPIPPSSGTFPLASVVFCHFTAALGAKAFAPWGLFVPATHFSHCSGFFSSAGTAIPGVNQQSSSSSSSAGAALRE